MTPPDGHEPAEIVNRLREQVASGSFRLTQHAHQEMAEEDLSLEEVLEAVNSGDILEHDPQHRRGSCCLLNGTTAASRPLHIVCTMARPVLIIITDYEPKGPKWVTPIERAPKP